jgi:pilus assembly protein TadC
VVIAVAGLVATLAAVLAAPRRTPRQRLSSLQPGKPAEVVRGEPSPRPGGPGRLHSPWSRRIVAAAALVAGVVVLGPVTGMVVGGGFAAVAILTTTGAEDAGVDGAAVALVADLVAGCLAAGTLLPDAVAAAGEGTDGGLGERCRSVAAALRAGASPERAWGSWLADPRLAPIARTAVRTAHSGAATADELRRTAARLRIQRKAGLQQRVRQASVWVVVPLGLCFLPAFVLLAVVPLVAGLLPTLS